MDEKKIVVPEGMSSAVAHAVLEQCGKCDYHPQIRVALEAALRFLSENPIVPTDAENHLLAEWSESHPEGCPFAEWQRRMFLAPRELEIPEEIKDLLVPARNLDEAHAGYGGTVLDHNQDVLKAYRRGQETPPKPQRCGEFFLASRIAGASFFPCALPKGHYGGHRAEGICSKHGPYFGKNNAVPECPQCAEMPLTAEQILRTNREVLSDDPSL